MLAATVCLSNSVNLEQEPVEGSLGTSCHGSCWFDSKGLGDREAPYGRRFNRVDLDQTSVASGLPTGPPGNARPWVLRLNAAGGGWGRQTAPPEAGRFPLDGERPGNGTTGNGTTQGARRGDGRSAVGRLGEVMPSPCTDAAGGKGPRAMDRAAKRGRSLERRRRGKRQACEPPLQKVQAYYSRVRAGGQGWGRASRPAGLQLSASRGSVSHCWLRRALAHHDFVVLEAVQGLREAVTEGKLQGQCLRV